MIGTASGSAGAARRMLCAALLLALSGCGDGPQSEGTNAMDETVADGTPTVAVDPAEMIFCPEIQKRVSRNDCDDLTSTAKLTDEGVGAFNVPPMTRGETTTVQLAIGYAPPPEPEPVEASPDAVEANAADTAADAPNMGGDEGPNTVATANPPRPVTPADVVENQPGPTEQYSPIVGAHMRADLIGQGFTIEPLSPPSQDLHPDSQTSWEWRVTPLKSTNYSLTIKTAVEGIAGDGTRYPLRSTVRNQPVTVEVTRMQKIADTLDATPEWLKRVTAVLTGLTALAAAIWALRRALKGEKTEKPEKK